MVNSMTKDQLYDHFCKVERQNGSYIAVESAMDQIRLTEEIRVIHLNGVDFYLNEWTDTTVCCSFIMYKGKGIFICMGFFFFFFH